MTLIATSIVNMHGQVYKDSGQGVKDILNKFYTPSVTMSEFNTVPTKETVTHMAKAITDRVFQIWQPEWTAVGGTTFTGLKHELTKWKINDGVLPDTLEDTWLGFLTTLDTNDRTKWPFIKWLLEVHIMPRAKMDFELYEIYKGTTVTITTPGTANAQGKNFIGLRKQINDFITAGDTDISTTVTGALSDDPETFLEQLEAWVAYCKERSALDREMWENGELDAIYMSPSRRDLAKRGMRKKYQMHWDQAGLKNNVNRDDSVKLMDTNIRLVGLPSMIGDNKIWATPEWNKTSKIKRPTSAQVFHVFQDGTNPYKVNYMLDSWISAGLWLGQFVYTNDLELV